MVFSDLGLQKSILSHTTHQNPVLCVLLLPHAIHMTFRMQSTWHSACNPQLPSAWNPQWPSACNLYDIQHAIHNYLPHGIHNDLPRAIYDIPHAIHNYLPHGIHNDLPHAIHNDLPHAIHMTFTSNFPFSKAQKPKWQNRLKLEQNIYFLEPILRILRTLYNLQLPKVGNPKTSEWNLNGLCNERIY
jgi:hypothetical protein